jgi:hypothetical protein
VGFFILNPTARHLPHTEDRMQFVPELRLISKPEVLDRVPVT